MKSLYRPMNLSNAKKLFYNGKRYFELAKYTVKFIFQELMPERLFAESIVLLWHHFLTVNRSFTSLKTVLHISLTSDCEMNFGVDPRTIGGHQGHSVHHAVLHSHIFYC